MNLAMATAIALATAAVLPFGLADAASAGNERPARSTSKSEAIIYRDAGYNGPAVSVSRAQANLALDWNVTSIRVRDGRWELCERTEFKGVCRTMTADNPIITRGGMRVQSMRPLDW